MRRKEKERTEKSFMEQVLVSAQEICLAFSPEEIGAAPYAVFMNHVYHDGNVYLHSALQGRKMALIQRNSLVGFTAAAGVKILTKEATTEYCSVCGVGRMNLVEDEQTKQAALKALAEKFAAHCPIPAPASDIRRVAILRLDIMEMTGKQSPAK